MITFLLILYIIIALILGGIVIFGFYTFTYNASNKWYHHVIYHIKGIGYGMLWPIWAIHMFIIEPILEAKERKKYE